MLENAIDFPVYNIANDPDNKNNKYVFFSIVLWAPISF